MFTADSIVAVRPFTRQREGEEVVIGNVATGTFLALPPEAVELIDLLAAGKSVGEVSESYREATGVTPDLEDLLSFLETKGLVEPFGKDMSVKETTRPPRAPKYHFSSFPQSLASMLFGRNALIILCLLLSLAIAAILSNHALMPIPGDLVFPEDRALSLTVLTLITYASIFLHELGHLVAARAVGVNSKMGISHRLWYLVSETDLTGLWSVPRQQRYLPLLAGMLVDTASASLLVLLLFAQYRHLIVLPFFLICLCRATIFTAVMRILWEFFLFTRTDLYFVAATFLNCKNLLNDTRVYLRNQSARIFARISIVDQSAIPPTERRAIRMYSGLFLGGRVWAFVTLFWVTIPVLVSYWGNLFDSFRTGYSANPADFLDAVATATFFLVPTVAGFVLWGRSFIPRKGA
jgi:putative peptide zinc metalloprotease protein